MAKLGRLHNTSDVKVGDKTNKGTIEAIYSLTDVRIDCCYYDLTKHKVYRQTN